MNTIAIDCGASFVKAALFESGEIKKLIQKSSPGVHTDEKITEIKYIPILVDLVKEIIDEIIIDKKEFNMCISNEMHGFLLAYEDGTPFTDYISWQNEYGNIEIDGVTSYDMISNEPKLKRTILVSGMPLRAGLPSTNLLFLKRSGILDESKKDLYFFTLGSYIYRCLSGKTLTEHPTNAAATGLYNLEQKEWNEEFINAIGVADITFPLIGNDVMDFEYKGRLIHAFPALGDQQAALLGAGFNREGDLSFNLGTGSQVSIISDSLQYGDGYQIRPFFNCKYLKTIPHIPSGRALNVFYRFVKSILDRYHCNMSEEDTWKGIIESVSEGNCNCGEMGVDLSFFENAVTDRTYGQIFNIPEWGFTINSLFVAVFDSLIKNNLLMADKLIKGGIKPDRVFFSGGIARRFKYVRDGILRKYRGAEEIVAENETLLGLYNYCQMREKKN